MPVFHTKTIESILEPVAFQVSRLVVLHQEAEDGKAMPDLSKPVQAVSRAVENLTKVGRETINNSNDAILRIDMPSSLQRVDKAARLLEEAAAILKVDAYSSKARHLLIEGSRGILQATSTLLLCFDQSEVRKIIKACEKVNSYMKVVEVIERMEDLEQFSRDLTQSQARVKHDVSGRSRELTCQKHREILLQCLDNMRQETPVLMSAMKIYIQLKLSHNSTMEAAENRDYHTQRICKEVDELIRVLQLTTYDEDDRWEIDSLNCMKRALGAMTSKIQSGHDWLEDPYAPNGGIGEKSLRQLLEHAEKIAQWSLPEDRDAIVKLCGDIRAMVNALCELRLSPQGAAGPRAQSLARNIGQKLRELLQLCTRAIANVEMGGIAQPAHSLSGRMDQAQRWLNNVDYQDHGLGEQAVQAIVDEARRLALACQISRLRQQMLDLCNEAESLNRELAMMVPRNQEKSRQLAMKLSELQRYIHAALVNRVMDDYIDAGQPLRQFTEAVLSNPAAPNREQQFIEKARNLSDWSRRATQTGRHVATNCAQNKRLADKIGSLADQLESETPQLINAGQIRFNHADNQTANENFLHMRDHYDSLIIELRNLIDEAIDSSGFVQASEMAIRRHTQLCELAISTRQVKSMVDNAASVARLANRVIMVARQESGNSEDTVFTSRIESVTRRLQELVPAMVGHARDVATGISDIRNHGPWRQCNGDLIEAVVQIGKELGPSEIGDLSRMMSHLSSTESSSSTTRKSTTTTTTTTKTLMTDQNMSNNNNNTNRYLLDQTAASGGGGPTSLSRSSGYRSDTLTSARNSAISPAQSTNQQQPGNSTPLMQSGKQNQQHYQQQQQHIGETTDDEFDENFPSLQPNQPIMMAARDLHQEVKQWSSKENEIIAAAKKIALLMARLSELVRGEKGTKKDLISCAKAIAEASQEVTRLAKEQAKLCTDRKMRTNILQVCERIPTMGTQLKILSTVKATMLGVQGSQEDQEAMDMIVGNAQNLMQSIKDTVRACETASIKIRTDQGVRVRWIRKEPWYT